MTRKNGKPRKRSRRRNVGDHAEPKRLPKISPALAEVVRQVQSGEALPESLAGLLARSTTKRKGEEAAPDANLESPGSDPFLQLVSSTALELEADLRLTGPDRLWLLALALLPASQVGTSAAMEQKGPLHVRDLELQFLMMLELVRVSAPQLFRPAISTDGGQLPALVSPSGQLTAFEDVPVPILAVMTPKILIRILKFATDWMRERSHPADTQAGRSDDSLAAVSEWKHKLNQTFVSPLIDGRPEPMVQRIRGMARKKGIELPTKRDEVTELLREYFDDESRQSLNRAGNAPYRVSDVGQIRLSEGQFLDWLRRGRKRNLLFGASNLRSVVETRPDPSAVDPAEAVIEAAEAVAAKRTVDELRRRARERGPAALAALERFEVGGSRRIFAAKHGVTEKQIIGQEGWIREVAAKLLDQAG